MLIYKPSRSAILLNASNHPLNCTVSCTFTVHNLFQFYLISFRLSVTDWQGSFDYCDIYKGMKNYLTEITYSYMESILQ